jgi:hypothetical protein
MGLAADEEAAEMVANEAMGRMCMRVDRSCCVSRERDFARENDLCGRR